MWPFRPDTSPGRRGERLAAKSLRRSGYKILARNYRCPAGEADLIALDPSTRRPLGAESIVFVEVKTRARDDFVDPESAVDRRKRRRLTRVAEYYLAHHDTGECPVRFDVVAVVDSGGGRPEIRHIPDAFPPAGRGL